MHIFSPFLFKWVIIYERRRAMDCEKRIRYEKRCKYSMYVAKFIAFLRRKYFQVYTYLKKMQINTAFA